MGVRDGAGESRVMNLPNKTCRWRDSLETLNARGQLPSAMAGKLILAGGSFNVDAGAFWRRIWLVFLVLLDSRRCSDYAQGQYEEYC